MIFVQVIIFLYVVSSLIPICRSEKFLSIFVCLYSLEIHNLIFYDTERFSFSHSLPYISQFSNSKSKPCQSIPLIYATPVYVQFSPPRFCFIFQYETRDLYCLFFSRLCLWMSSHPVLLFDIHLLNPTPLSPTKYVKTKFYTLYLSVKHSYFCTSPAFLIFLHSKTFRKPVVLQVKMEEAHNFMDPL